MKKNRLKMPVFFYSSKIKCGFEAVPSAKAALAYSKSVEGLQTGKVYPLLY